MKFIIKDCGESLIANPENPNNGYYQDEINYASMEINRRKPINPIKEAFHEVNQHLFLFD